MGRGTRRQRLETAWLATLELREVLKRVRGQLLPSDTLALVAVGAVKAAIDALEGVLEREVARCCRGVASG